MSSDPQTEKQLQDLNELSKQIFKLQEKAYDIAQQIDLTKCVKLFEAKISQEVKTYRDFLNNNPLPENYPADPIQYSSVSDIHISETIMEIEPRLKTSLKVAIDNVNNNGLAPFPTLSCYNNGIWDKVWTVKVFEQRQ